MKRYVCVGVRCDDVRVPQLDAMLHGVATMHRLPQFVRLFCKEFGEPSM